ncbi:hypothetical protein CGI90_26510, partial [Vibrio parahaemolyticus]|uniref:hypothetical protein n=1 Tax=Vibrio parahaemolyticus TaxID=670 RepID=UPI0011689EF5
NSASDMIKVALQLREEYQELRDWLNCYQQALSDGSYKDMNKFSKTLQSISLYVDSTTQMLLRSQQALVCLRLL